MRRPVRQFLGFGTRFLGPHRPIGRTTLASLCRIHICKKELPIRKQVSDEEMEILGQYYEDPYNDPMLDLLFSKTTGKIQ